MEEQEAVTAARLIGDQVRRLLRAAAMARAAVVGTTAQGLVLVRWPESDVADDQAYARLAGFELAVGDEVLVLPLAGVPVVLGKLQRSAPESYVLNQRLDIKPPAGATRTLVLYDENGDMAYEFRTDLAAGQDALRIHGGFLRLYSGRGGSIVATLNASGRLTCAEVKDASLINTSGMKTLVQAQNTADTSSTTDTVNWSTALSQNFSVPAGTWQVTAVGFVNLRNDGSHTSHARVEVDGTAGSQFSRTAGPLGSPHFISFVPYASKAGVTNTTINVKVQFRSGSGGTTTAANPAVWVEFFRTA